MIHQFDFLVIGSGIAGLFYAQQVAPHGTVAVITKKKKKDSNTNLAQGGIAAVVGQGDSYDSHIADTLQAGAGLCHRDVVEMVVHEGPQRINDLIQLGVQFTESSSGCTYDLTREGGHSNRRILHAADWTGREIEKALINHCQEHPRITIFEDMAAIDLLTSSKYLDVPPQHDCCWGTYALECKTGMVHTFLARQTVITTGGAGKVYLFTTNPDIATGDGVAMASRAGARIANMEFFQFHPTCLYHPKTKNFLISEAVRGEGGILRRRDGQQFMGRYSAAKELASRDIVARAIDNEMKSTGDDCVFLDITHLSRDYIQKRFPLIHSTCLQLGIDITREPIPVVPAAHYLCGGIVVDHDGCSSLSRLFACGEAACTGLHGANRLASNSLLEAVVYASRAARASVNALAADRQSVPRFPDWVYTQRSDVDENVIISHNWDEIRRLMWSYVGIVRSQKRLLRAKHRIDLLHNEIREFYWDHVLSSDLLELRNIAVVADLIISAAMYRKESRGLHYNIDYPERDDADWLVDTVQVAGQCFSLPLHPDHLS
ncbi:MAG: L-aspartate oxidase [Deltaproteobacteria bacterium]|nr:L-aspartate oxidase [Candidatus Anaeroferrophillus wilburensis]MBN2889866.1 L-aspartate oxidase [Deltaproteobacteria bacterium]